MEEKLIGKWTFKDGKIVADSNCDLIDSMIKNDLKQIKISKDNWTKIYKHSNGSMWRLTYPESNLQGGGPPSLTKIKKW